MESVQIRSLSNHHMLNRGKSAALHRHRAGGVVLFLHGVPTFSYLWRNIIPDIPETYNAVNLTEWFVQ